jgi:CheY-like chemotaxis protein
MGAADLQTALGGVLIADAHRGDRLRLGASLSACARVFEAGDGTQAMHLLNHHRPAVVLLDASLPGPEGGLALLRTIKGDARTRHIRVAVLTARGRLQDRQAARAGGADAHFARPFPLLAVWTWARRALSTPRSPSTTAAP